MGGRAERIRQEFAVLASSHRLSPAARSLADGDRDTLRQLGEALTVSYEALVRPFTSHIQARLDGDRGLRACALLDGGVDALLSSLRPTMQWHSPVLEASFPSEQDLHLRGRGLVLVPSYFCWDKPVTLADPDLPPVLVYPAAYDPPDAEAPEAALGNLIGTTRATVLRAIGAGGGTTTTELARSTGMSPASTSEHTKVLREAGLVTSIRNGNSVLHATTPLGRGLLRGV
ncbi:MarR family transcriptional regulator [Fodinicola acaciae]|uniref:MarR family transcriptional regulator n=1 Tax=Fodinicola acaciae TaxID=2681555 RepID=UPI001C9E809C|nr:helix-turn-helix domain-containing protein [Fodinicola acaciae]